MTPEPHVVTLTDHEIQYATFVASRRHDESIRNGFRNRYGCDDADGADNDAVGAAAELAVAKALGRYWTGVGGIKAPDVRGYEVRSTRRAHGRLILHPDDPDDAVFVLVTGAAPTLCLRGWIVARDGKHDLNLEDPTGTGRWAYFVPHADLRPIAELLRRGPRDGDDR